MVKAEVLFDGNLIYINGLVIEKGCFNYFVTNSDDTVLKDYVTIEDAVKFCLKQ